MAELRGDKCGNVFASDRIKADERNRYQLITYDQPPAYHDIE